MGKFDITAYNNLPGVLRVMRHELNLISDIDSGIEYIQKVGFIQQRAKQLRLSLADQNKIAAFRTDAERIVGRMLAEMEKHKGAANALASRKGVELPRLSDLGVNYTQSSRWQKMASWPESLYESEKNKILDSNNEWSSAHCLRQIKEWERQEMRKETAELAKETESPDGIYRTIVIDPPWLSEESGDKDSMGRLRPNYQMLSIEEIADESIVPVRGVAHPNDCHLYLWVTNRIITDASSLIHAWGFRYITMITWCKPTLGVGRYFRNNTEHVLFGIRGSRLLARSDMGTWFESPRSRHSEKPPAFYQIVERCSPGPRLEMFARESRVGWAVWGAEV